MLCLQVHVWKEYLKRIREGKQQLLAVNDLKAHVSWGLYYPLTIVRLRTLWGDTPPSSLQRMYFPDGSIPYLIGC